VLQIEAVLCFLHPPHPPCFFNLQRPQNITIMWCVFVCGLETSWMRRLWTAVGRSTTKRTYEPTNQLT